MKKLINLFKENNVLAFNIMAIILIIIFSISITPVTLQNDTFYTIKIGELINNHGIDMKDHFSWHEGLPYTYPHWLYDLITYFVYAGFGVYGIYIMTCILSAILGVSIYIVCRKLVKNDIISFVITMLAMYLLNPYIAARAQLVTFILFIWTIFFIEKFIQTKKIRYAIALIIIPILIANLHLAVWPFYFVLYLPYIAEYLIAIFAEIIIYQKIKIASLNYRIKTYNKKLKIKENNEIKEKLEKTQQRLERIQEKVKKVRMKRESEIKNPYKLIINKNDNVKWLILVMIICIFTGLLTPLGVTPYTYLPDTLRGNTTQNINEHLPLTLAQEENILTAILIFLAILIFTKTKIRLSDLFMLSGLCYLMLLARRQISMFVLVGCVILARLIFDLCKIYIKDAIPKINKLVSSFVSIILITSIVVLISYDFFKDKKGAEIISTSSYPVKACDFILENIDLGQARFYNEYNYGSYMIFRGIPVFIDSRADLYAPEFNKRSDDIFMDFIETSNISVFYEDILDKYNITHVILYDNSKMNMIIEKTQDPNYNKLYEDDYFVVYERLSEKE